MKKHLLAIAIFMSSLAFSTFAQAKDLTNRLGVGYRNQFSQDLPGVAVQYWPNRDFGLSGVMGVDTQQGAGKFGLMLKAFKVIFPEDNLNFYFGAGAGMVNFEGTGATAQNGWEFQGFFGTEFFFTGLENVGFSFEAGVAVTSTSNNVRFRTMADSPLRAGMTFYF